MSGELRMANLSAGVVDDKGFSDRQTGRRGNAAELRIGEDVPVCGIVASVHIPPGRDIAVCFIGNYLVADPSDHSWKKAVMKHIEAMTDVKKQQSAGWQEAGGLAEEFDPAACRKDVAKDIP